MFRKIHRIWIQGEEDLKIKEPEYYSYDILWKKFFPGYEVKLWSEKDYLPLIEKYSRLLKNSYDFAPSYACKSDIARYVILYFEGGLYVDTDTEPLKNYNYLLNDPKIELSLVRLNLNRSKLFFCGYTYSNSWLYAKKKCSYLAVILNKISQEHYIGEDKLDYTWNITGPGALSKLVKKYKLEEKSDVRIFSHSVIEITSFANSSDANMSSKDLLLKYPFALNVHRMRASWIPRAWFYKLLGRIYTFYNNWSDIIILISLFLNIYLVIKLLKDL